MKYLFFDTETTGLPLSWKAPVTDLSNWPRLVQLAYGLYDSHGKRLEEGNHIVKPNGYIIPKASSDIHGITHEVAEKDGEEMDKVLSTFSRIIAQCDYLVAHNMSFDEKIIGAEFLRNKNNNFIDNKPKICTMHSTTNFCAISGKYGYKWPTLQELHKKLFGVGFKEAHDAYVDVSATVRCFFELKKTGVL